MENRDNMGCSGDKNGFRYAAIDCWPYPESNPDYVLSWASLVFGSGYVDGTNFVRA
jgi:hypothetical protein